MILRYDEDRVSDDDNDATNNRGWTDYVGRHKPFLFSGQGGMKTFIPPDYSPVDVFRSLIDDKVIDHIVCETNKYADQEIDKITSKPHSRLKKWSSTNSEEIKQFLGLILWMGLVRLGSLENYWSKKRIYQQAIPTSVLSRNRFQLLLSMIHFSHNATAQDGDRLAKILPLIDILESNFKNMFCPEKDIVIDETLIPWRERLIFRQYIPNKAHRYGIKMFKLCSIDGYTWDFRIYAGKSATGQREIGLAQKVCLELAKDLLNESRTLYVDNFYTSYEPAKSFLQKETQWFIDTCKIFFVGTLRANKKDFPKEVLKAKHRRGEMIAKEDQDGIVVLKWRDTRNVRNPSTKHALIMAPVRSMHSHQSTPTQPSTSSQVSAQQPSTSAQPTITTQPSTSTQPSSSHSMQTSPVDNTSSARQQRRRRATEKPIAILAYNKGKSGTDKSDQMASYATSLRKGLK